MQGAMIMKKNIALIGPNGSGKTTLLESLLFVAGATDRRGRVADKNTIGDSSAEARERQMSTEMSVVSFSHDDVDFTIIDCPGSVEFIQEMRAALLGVDLAVVVIEPVLERMIAVAPIFHLLEVLDLPHLVFINKMDRSEVRYRDLLQGLRDLSAKPVVPHQYAIGRGDELVGYIDLVTEQAYAYGDHAPADEMPFPEEYREREQAARSEMLDTLADFDEDLMVLLLEDEEPPAEEILRNMQKTLGADQVVPVFLGVAEHEKGVRRLLDALVKEAPAPDVRAQALGIDAGDATIVQILKNFNLPHAGKLSVARVWAGKIDDGMTLSGMRVGGVYSLFGAQHDTAGTAQAGAIVGLARMEEAQAGQIYATDAALELDLMPRLETPEPMFAFAVTAANKADEVKLSAAFAKLTDEDPSIRIEQDPEVHQTLLSGQGEIHLRVAMDRLRNKYNIEVQPEAPKTPYRETIRKTTHAHGRHKKQSGGHGQFGDVKVDIKPLPRGEGFAFENKIVGGAIPKQYIPAVEQGAKDFLSRGPLGFKVVDVGITLVDGQFHSVDSNEMSFKMASALALKEGLPQCSPVLLEPILSVKISVPSDYTSKTLALISGKRGQILGYDGKDGWQGWDEVKAQIPQGEIHDLIVNLRSLSQGTGFYHASYDHLQEVPDKIAQDIVKANAAAAH